MTRDSTQPMSIMQQRVDELFTYHSFSTDQVERSSKIRHAAKQLAHAVLENTKVGDDQYESILKIREATFLANAAIALEGK